MTTQALRDAMSLVATNQDPAEYQFFDISGAVGDQTNIETEPLMAYRPPFPKCVVVFRGKTKSHDLYDVLMLIAGDDPEEGIVVSMWKGPYGQRPRTLPAMVYLIDGDMLRYGPLGEEDQVEESTAKLMLSMVAAWYKRLAAGTEMHTAQVAQTFTNRRKIAQGKTPTYSWTTVVIGPKKAKTESKGGTHASPREHDRRGHLRRLRNGKNCWVKPCKVGSRALGAVFHDYVVKEVA